MDNKYKNLTIFLVILIIAYVAYIYLIKKENFSLFNESTYIDKVSTKYFTDNKDLSLTNGMVFKHICDAGYQYLYKFNLPNPVAGIYIDGQDNPYPYTVLAGTSKDNLEKIGVLQRSSDGWFYFSIETDKEYIYTKIVTNPGNKVIFEKNI